MLQATIYYVTRLFLSLAKSYYLSEKPAKDTAKNIESLSFEDAIKELESIVRKLESGQISLEQSIDDYTRGTSLKNHCEKRLKEAKMKIEKITKTPDGGLKIDEFEAE